MFQYEKGPLTRRLGRYDRGYALVTGARHGGCRTVRRDDDHHGHLLDVGFLPAEWLAAIIANPPAWAAAHGRGLPWERRHVSWVAGRTRLRIWEPACYINGVALPKYQTSDLARSTAAEIVYCANDMETAEKIKERGMNEWFPIIDQVNQESRDRWGGTG